MNKFYSITNPSRQTFTLIELLVVIAMIAILAGILLPTLNSARDRASTVNCISNLKQLSSATAMYTGEFQGYFPPGGSKDYLSGTIVGYPYCLIKNRYLVSGMVYRCPAARTGSGVWEKSRMDYWKNSLRYIDNKHSTHFTTLASYGQNLCLGIGVGINSNLPAYYKRAPKLEQVRYPSRTHAYLETESYEQVLVASRFQLGSSIALPYLMTTSYGGYGVVHGNHKNSRVVNGSRVDGSVHSWQVPGGGLGNTYTVDPFQKGDQEEHPGNEFDLK